MLLDEIRSQWIRIGTKTQGLVSLKAEEKTCTHMEGGAKSVVMELQVSHHPGLLKATDVRKIQGKILQLSLQKEHSPDFRFLASRTTRE